MKKIPTVFVRDHETHLVTPEVTPGCEWVLAGQGLATRKWDGAAVLRRGGVFYKRYDAKAGRTPPEGFEPAQDEPDPITGHWPGWLKIGDGPEDKWLRAAIDYSSKGELLDGTYEACGPHFQGNPERFPSDRLLPHGAFILHGCPREFEPLREWLRYRDIEGVVFHGSHGRMAKVKLKDFGLKRPGQRAEMPAAVVMGS